MQELCRLWNSNSFSEQNFVTYVLAELAADGTLKPLTDAQKSSVNTIMFSDTLPQWKLIYIANGKLLQLKLQVTRLQYSSSGLH